MTFILRIKIKDKAKNTLIYDPTNFDELKKTICDRFKPKKTLASIHSELSKVKQGPKSISVYASEIEALITDLNKINFSSQGIQANI